MDRSEKLVTIDPASFWVMFLFTITTCRRIECCMPSFIFICRFLTTDYCMYMIKTEGSQQVWPVNRGCLCRFSTCSHFWEFQGSMFALFSNLFYSIYEFVIFILVIASSDESKMSWNYYAIWRLICVLYHNTYRKYWYTGFTLYIVSQKCLKYTIRLRKFTKHYFRPPLAFILDTPIKRVVVSFLHKNHDVDTISKP